MSTVAEPLATKDDHPVSPPLSPGKKAEKEEDGDVSSHEKPTSVKQEPAKRNSGETASTLSETLAAHTESVSEKRNREFHTLFKSIPEDDNLVEDYGCALQKEILVQGRLYISETHLCFNANIFGWVTNFAIAFSDITEVEKRTTAIFIPNAINIVTSDNTHYLFASFLSRDQAYDLITEVWQYARSMAAGSSSGMESDDEGEDEDEELATSFDEEEESDGDDTEVEMKKETKPTSQEPAPKAPAATSAPAAPKSSKQVKEKTECVCAGDHYPNTVLDEVYDGTLEALYSLLYTCGFMKKFLTEDEELSEVEIGEWQVSGDDKQQTRNTSYIKPLNGAIGPKQTKCLQTEKVIHNDLADSVTVDTITQTPDVPSGGSFSVKTRTCMTWAGKAKVRLLVTVMVDFTKTSWIKSTIEKASVDGQVSFYQDLSSAIRRYIQQHPSEFSLDGKHFKGKRKVTKKRRPRKQHHVKTLWETCRPVVAAISVQHLILLCLIALVGIQLYMAVRAPGVEQRAWQPHP